MKTIAVEMRHLARRLLRSPGFTGLSVLTLALGIGANASIFTVVNSVLLRPLPFPDQDRLYTIQHTAPGMNMAEVPNSEATYFIYRDENRVFDAFGVFRDGAENVTGGEEPERVTSVTATHEVFDVFGVVPTMGRLTTEEDDTPGAPPVAILSYGLWQRRFGEDPSILDRTLQVNGETRDIIGVLPRGFAIPGEEKAELYLPARFDRTEPDEGSFNYRGVARLSAGITKEAARTDMDRMIRLIPERFSGAISLSMLEQIQFAPLVTQLKEEVTGEVSRALWISLAAVGLVLLIACANVANLFLVRADGRHREVAVRSAMGASRGDLARFFLTESMALGMLGGLVGLTLAWAATRALVALGPEGLPRLDQIRLDLWAVAFTTGISLLAGTLFGLFPVVKFRAPEIVAGLKEGGRGGSVGRERHRARNVLVVSQMALALILLVGSGLMLRSFQALRNVDPGFQPDGVLTLRLTLPYQTYSDDESRVQFHTQLHERLSGLSGVESVGAAATIPLSGRADRSGTWFEDFPVQPDQVPDVIETTQVTAGFFSTLGIGLLEGRFLEPADAQDRTGAVVVSRALAEKYWPDGGAIGKHLTQSVDLGVETAGSDSPWQTIVGVVEDVRTLGMDVEPQPLLFFPLRQAVPEGVSTTAQSMSYVIRTSTPPTALVPAVRQAIWSLDPNLPIAGIQTMDALVKKSMARTSFTLLLLAIASLVALVLGTVGVYGVLSYVVTQRTRELGIRMALGAKGEQVERMVLGQGARLAGLGIGIGVVTALALTRVMASLLFQVSPTDPVTFAGAVAALVLVALAATYLPARRAAMTDPMEALRFE
jgi:predicted permease